MSKVVYDKGRRELLKKGVFTLFAGAVLALASKVPFVHAAGTIRDAELRNYSETTVTANTGASYTVDLSDGNVFKLTLTSNCTFTFSNAPVTGKSGSFTLVLIQDGTGSRTVTWPASVDWAGGTEPTLSTSASSVDILGFFTTDGGTTWYGFLSGSDMQ